MYGALLWKYLMSDGTGASFQMYMATYYRKDLGCFTRSETTFGEQLDIRDGFRTMSVVRGPSFIRFKFIFHGRKHAWAVIHSC